MNERRSINGSDVDLHLLLGYIIYVHKSCKSPSIFQVKVPINITTLGCKSVACTSATRSDIAAMPTFIQSMICCFGAKGNDTT